MIYYRLEKNDLGKQFTFNPVVPSGQCGSELALYSKHKRICVAPSIEKCLLALSGRGDRKLYVYAVENPRPIEHGKPKKCVGDWKFTKEAWLIKPTEFKRIGRINITKQAVVDWAWKDESELIDMATKVRVKPKFSYT